MYDDGHRPFGRLNQPNLLRKMENSRLSEYEKDPIIHLRCENQYPMKEMNVFLG